jgi:hypothetical protein
LGHRPHGGAPGNTDQAPEELRARANELRAEAEATDIKGIRDAALALADRYEEAAAR